MVGVSCTLFCTACLPRLNATGVLGGQKLQSLFNPAAKANNKPRAAEGNAPAHRDPSSGIHMPAGDDSAGLPSDDEYFEAREGMHDDNSEGTRDDQGQVPHNDNDDAAVAGDLIEEQQVIETLLERLML